MSTLLVSDSLHDLSDAIVGADQAVVEAVEEIFDGPFVAAESVDDALDHGQVGEGHLRITHVDSQHVERQVLDDVEAGVLDRVIVVVSCNDGEVIMILIEGFVSIVEPALAVGLAVGGHDRLDNGLLPAGLESVDVLGNVDGTVHAVVDVESVAGLVGVSTPGLASDFVPATRHLGLVPVALPSDLPVGAALELLACEGLPGKDNRGDGERFH